MQISPDDILKHFGFVGYPVTDWPDVGLRLEEDGIWADPYDWDVVKGFTPGEREVLTYWFPLEENSDDPDGPKRRSNKPKRVLSLPCELHDLIAFLDKADCTSNCAYFDDTLDRWVYPLHELAEQESQQAKPEAIASESEETPDERRTRLIARREELKKQGVRNFNQKIAEEEGISPQRVKQLLGCNRKTPKAAKATPFDSIAQPAKGYKY